MVKMVGKKVFKILPYAEIFVWSKPVWSETL